MNTGPVRFYDFIIELPLQNALCSHMYFGGSVSMFSFSLTTYASHGQKNEILLVCRVKVFSPGKLVYEVEFVYIINTVTDLRHLGM